MLYVILPMLLLVSTSECAINVTVDVIFKYHSNIVLDCLNGSNVTFYKTDINGNNVKQLLPDGSKYVLNSTGISLIITNSKKDDIISKYFCNNSNGDLVKFNELIIPHLYHSDAIMLTSTEGLDIDLSCHMLIAPINSNNQSVNWTWSVNWTSCVKSGTRYEQLQTTDHYSFINVDGFNSTLKISKLKIEDSGVYFCRVFNEYGYHERNVTLKVKSHLTPVWPFLGLVGEITIMAILIGLYEYNKKHNDKAQDPQVVSPETPEEGNKKRI